MDHDPRLIADLADDFDNQWQAGRRPELSEFLGQASPHCRAKLAEFLIPIDVEYRCRVGEAVSPHDYRPVLDRFELSESFDLPALLGSLSDISHRPTLKGAPNPNQPMGKRGGDSGETGRKLAEEAVALAPFLVGRYRIERELGTGGFGKVFKAFDGQLERSVAIKVPHADLSGDRQQLEAHLAEAKAVAALDHPNIVPVYDVGSTADYPLFIVSKFIEGEDLATLLKQRRLGYRSAAMLISAVAEALNHAHQQGFVHRDIKPANILVNRDLNPFVVDFGLALKEEKLGEGPRYAGTPAYMSPEQARGEGHRVDGRSDVFSLGAVFYEILVGKRPFRGDSLLEIYEQIINHEPKPPRQYDSHLPKELERICLKCLAKRATERYSTAADLVSDLRLFLIEQESIPSGTSPSGNRPGGLHVPAVEETADPQGSSGDERRPSSGWLSSAQRLKVIPKGLRSFDSYDSDFFLELLPGPRDRNGLPDSLRFWKTRIESADPQQSFTVGLVYGPSGCGKSSMVKAGLLPRLSSDVCVVYLEATPEATESQLLAALRGRCPALDEKLDLRGSLQALRRGQGVPPGKKVLIVLDQFEQWLHARRMEDSAELPQALRQCDGIHLQAIIMVRDDFWMAATRFLKDLEVRLVEGENSAAVDLFPLRHANKVLIAFGRAYQALPEEQELTARQSEFVKAAVHGLAEDGKVISVRLALFAEMMKSREWDPATLDAVGGAGGLGVTFLEETFHSRSAPPTHRYHQQAARAVLGALLPDRGTKIKGSMLPFSELEAVSGYRNRPREFTELLDLLDSQLRLITPAEGPDLSAKPALGSSVETGNGRQESKSSREPTRCYQLTHDYLVPAIRDWLTLKQRETRRGRAELKLTERASAWTANPENKQLPTLAEWTAIRLLTSPARWKSDEQSLMLRANRFHLLRLTLFAGFCGLLLVAGLGLKRWSDARIQEREASLLVEKLRSAELDRIPYELSGLPPLRQFIDRKLKSAIAGLPLESLERMKLSLGLLPSDPAQADYLAERLLTAEPKQVQLLVSQLKPYSDQLSERLWEVAEKKDPQNLLAVASALASDDPDNERWTGIGDAVGDLLVRENPLRFSIWIETLEPAKQHLLSSLQKVFHSLPGSLPTSQIELATEALAVYAADDFEVLHAAMLDGQAFQFDRLFPSYEKFQERAVKRLITELQATHPGSNHVSREPGSGRLSRLERQANATVALTRLGVLAPVFDFLQVTGDPEPLSQFVSRVRGRGVPAGALISGLKELLKINEGQTTQPQKQNNLRLYAFVLALGELDRTLLTAAESAELIKELSDLYQSHPSSAVHSAVGWLLRRWGQMEVLRKVEQTPLPYDQTGVREWFVIRIMPAPKDGLSAEVPGAIEPAAPVFFTMVVIPPGELNKGEPDQPVLTRIPKPLAVSDREVTWQQFAPLDNDDRRRTYEKQFQRSLGPEEPAFGVSWFEAVNYCRWLTGTSGLDESGQCYPQIDLPEGHETGWINGLADDTEWPLDKERPGFRLLTSDEWEYVARAGMSTQFSFGTSVSLLPEYGWFLANSNQWPHVTGELRPNVRGIFDIHGNLNEWTNDRQSAGNRQVRVYRGGSWRDEAMNCRSNQFAINLPSERVNRAGFRLAMTLPIAESQSAAGGGE